MRIKSAYGILLDIDEATHMGFCGAILSKAAREKIEVRINFKNIHGIKTQKDFTLNEFLKKLGIFDKEYN